MAAAIIRGCSQMDNADTFVFMATLGEHEQTANGRKNRQRLQKPRDNIGPARPWVEGDAIGVAQ
jgi:hypothetical protein